MARFRLLSLVLLIIACTAGGSPKRTANPVSTDGEATVYVMGEFSRGFNLAYYAVLRPTPTNRSNTFIGIMLLGRRNPGSSIALGLTRAASIAHALRFYLSISAKNGGNHYTTFPAACSPSCELILRGDRYALYAFVVTEDGIRKLGAWSRADLELVRPYVQLNGEVTRPGDSIAGALTPIRMVADSLDLSAPTCAFTTRGILPRRDPNGTLTFSGSYGIEAPASFIDLKSGRFVDRCPHR